MRRAGRGYAYCHALELTPTGLTAARRTLPGWDAEAFPWVVFEVDDRNGVVVAIDAAEDAEHASRYGVTP